MNAPHPSDEDLVLHYYDEGARPARLEVHLDECPACRQRFETLRASLAVVADDAVASGPVPEFGAREVERAWQALAPRLAAERGRRRLRQVMAPLAIAASLIVAFAVGRQWPGHAPAPAGGQDRILLVALGDHLERSEMLLVELVNAPAGEALDISPEQVQARDLVGDSRVYRAAVTRAGEPGLASVLEELERLLVEVAHRPSELTPEDLDALRRRIESRGLLFKVRVLESQVREKQKEPAPGTAAVS